MMVMSRNLKALVIFAFGVWLSSCGEEPPGVESQGEIERIKEVKIMPLGFCLLYTSPSPRDGLLSRMPSSA